MSLDAWIQFRRDLHKIPELGGEEYETQRYLMRKLCDFGLMPEPIAKTGVKAVLDTRRPGPVLAFRADMDGLAVEEQNDVEYKSTHPGRMHACGHDFHMATLLGLADTLTREKEALCGKVVFFFQPAEEALCGSRDVIECGALNDPKPDAIFGLHVWDLPLGTAGLKSGPLMAAPAFFEVKVTGVGGHGAEPFKCKNPITVAAQIVSAFDSLANSFTHPTKPLVVSVCSLEAGHASNVIPDTAVLRGTVRTFDDDLMPQILSLLSANAERIASAFGCQTEFITHHYHGAVRNDADLAQWAKDTLGEEFPLVEPIPSMIGEDFSNYAQVAPSLFLWIGASPCKLHDPKNDPHERAIAVGVAALTKLAKAKLSRDDA